MNITKLVGNIDQIRSRFSSKFSSNPEKFGPLESTVDNMLAYVVEYKKWSDAITNYSKDTSLQNLPLDYYQICQGLSLQSYQQAVRYGIPRLLELGIVDKNGNLL